MFVLHSNLPIYTMIGTLIFMGLAVPLLTWVMASIRERDSARRDDENAEVHRRLDDMESRLNKLEGEA